MTRVLYLFNKVRINTQEIENIIKKKGHDNHFFSMFRLRRYGFETDFLELEQYAPRWLTVFLRKYVLNIFWVHLPLFPLFLRYDIIFSSTAYGSLLLKAIIRLRKPKWVILDFNISGTIGDGKSFRRKLFKYAVSKSDGIVTISEAETKTLKLMFPHLEDRIAFFHEGIDINFFKPDPQILEEDFILSVGLDPSRDFKTLIEAAKDLPISVKFATKPERVAEFHPLPSNISTHLFSHDEMLRQYAKAKVIIVGLNMKHDNNDSMGTFAVAEAMAMGKAVVATRTKSLESYITDGVTGKFVPKHDVDTMRTAIKELLEDDRKRKEMGRMARQFIVEHADAEIFAKNLAGYFKSLLQ